jgi:hypothetical protein
MVTVWPRLCRPTAASMTSLSAPPMPRSGWKKAIVLAMVELGSHGVARSRCWTRFWLTNGSLRPRCSGRYSGGAQLLATCATQAAAVAARDAFAIPSRWIQITRCLSYLSLVRQKSCWPLTPGPAHPQNSVYASINRRCGGLLRCMAVGESPQRLINRHAVIPIV